MMEATHEQEVLRFARQLVHHGADWVKAYRELLGTRGLIRRTYSSREELAEFEQTGAYREIQQMLRELREQGASAESSLEPTSVITVRLPKSVHDALKVEAHEHQTSMNKLCISKLLQFIDNSLVPSDTPRPADETVEEEA